MQNKKERPKVAQELSPESQDRAETFAVLVNIDSDKLLQTGMQAALQTFAAFVSTLPKRFLEPSAFAKVLASNIEFLYSLIEATGTSITDELVSLRDQVKEAEAVCDDQRESTLDVLQRVSKFFKTQKFCLGDDEAHPEVESEDEFQDLPYWKVTVSLPDDTKITHILDHIETAQYFPNVEIVQEDPDPTYDGPEGFPNDGVDDHFEPGTFPPSSEWDEPDEEHL